MTKVYMAQTGHYIADIL